MPLRLNSIARTMIGVMEYSNLTCRLMFLRIHLARENEPKLCQGPLELNFLENIKLTSKECQNAPQKNGHYIPKKDLQELMH